MQQRAPGSCSPIRPRDLLNERYERLHVDGRRVAIGQFRRSDHRDSYQRHAATNPASAVAKFSAVISMAAYPVSIGAAL
jgi:hypothetical protein